MLWGKSGYSTDTTEGFLFVCFWLDIVKAEQRSILDLKRREKMVEPVINYTL